MSALTASSTAGAPISSHRTMVGGMPFTIMEADPADWDRIHRACPHATWCQGRRWMQHLARFHSPRHDARPIAVGAWHFRFADGLEGIIPYQCFCATRGLTKKFISGGDSLYGGWVGNAYPQSGHAEVLRKFLHSRNLTIRQSPFAPATLPTDRYDVTPEFSAVLDLGPGIDAIEADWRRNSPKILQYSRKAARAGVEVRRSESREEWLAFAEAHRCLLQRRADATVYNRDFFASLHALGAPEAQLWIALRNDRVIAGQLALLHGSHAGLFVKGATSEALALRAPVLVDTTMINACCRAGVRWYDHDGCGAPDASIREYKRRLGCAFLSSPILEHRRGLLAAVSCAKSALKSWGDNPVCARHSSRHSEQDHEQVI